MTLSSQLLHRYPTLHEITSILDPMQDMLTLMESLTSSDYVTTVLVKTHGLSPAAAKTRARALIPHVRAALQYVNQGLGGPTDVAFLPLYYALLDFPKVSILVGHYHDELPANRWHGATYQGYARDSQSLLTEEVILKKGGAIPLLYRTLTGATLTSDVKIRMRDVFPYIPDVGAEYSLGTGDSPRLARLQFQLVPIPDGAIPTIRAIRPGRSIKKTELKVLIDFRKDHTQTNTFVTEALDPQTQSFAGIRDRFRPFLFYQGREFYYTPICARHLLLPEELPILLAFFHMSSVVRYKPEFLAKLRDSRFWPMLLAAQRHCLLKYLMLSWSYLHQMTFSLAHG